MAQIPSQAKRNSLNENVKKIRCTTIMLLISFLFTFLACSCSSYETSDLCESVIGVPKEETLFTVDGQKVCAGLYLYWIINSINEDKEFSKEEIAQNASEDLIIQINTEQMGFSLTEETETQIENDVVMIEQSYGGKKEFQQMLDDNGIDRKIYTMLLTTPYCETYLLENAFTGHPTEEEKARYVEKYNLARIKCILISTTNSDGTIMSKAEQAEQKTLAENILSRIRESADPEKTFDELMHEYSSDTTAVAHPKGYIKSLTDFPEKFSEVVPTLKYGEISDIIECTAEDNTGYTGYNIILNLNPMECEYLEEDWINEQVKILVGSWIENAEYEYTDFYKALNIGEVVDKYTAYQQNKTQK